MKTNLYINTNDRLDKINAEIYGQFSEHLGRCIYEGIFVGKDSPIPNENGMRKDVVEALREIKVPVLRWPGGCFADEYHWMDGIGPQEKRRRMVNSNWGGTVEDNSFGTHEFFELCRQIGCKTYVNGNVGSGTVREMAEWIEYMTFDRSSTLTDMRAENGHKEPWTLDYFAVGNENWGGGGNMTPTYYADVYRRYQTYIRTYENVQPAKKICCGPNVDDYEWTDVVMKNCFNRCDEKNHGFMDGISLHYYTLPEDTWEHKGSALDFDQKSWYKTLTKAHYLQELIEKHVEIMDRYDVHKKVALVVDEWGLWTDVEPGTNPGFLYQQSTMRDALVAGISLNILNNHCDRVKMANIAQMVNVLQAMVLTEGDKMIKTPTYYVFKMYKDHQESQLLKASMETKMIGLEETYQQPMLTHSVSMDQEGKIQITITNASLTESAEVTLCPDCEITDIKGQILTGEMADHNTFENPECLKIRDFDGITVGDSGICLQIPGPSVVHITMECK